MDQWLDSLSEDWISQPASPRSASSKQTSILRDAPSPSSNGSQSRIPRYKPRSASNLSTTSVQEDGLGSSLRRANSNEAALKEKTSSNLNASRNRMPNGQGPGTASRKVLGRHVSTGSIPIVPQDTVQVKLSPAKNIDGKATPDWKRRVLKENVGKGDLFSPIGLENMFRPPTVGPKQKAKPAVVKKKSSKKEDLPSSPPSYPALTRQEPNTPAGEIKELTMASPPPSALSEKNNSRHLVPQEIECHQQTTKKRKGSSVPTITLQIRNRCQMKMRAAYSLYLLLLLLLNMDLTIDQVLGLGQTVQTTA